MEIPLLLPTLPKPRLGDPIGELRRLVLGDRTGELIILFGEEASGGRFGQRALGKYTRAQRASDVA